MSFKERGRKPRRGYIMPPRDYIPVLNKVHRAETLQSTFSPFPRLPSELRLQIWLTALKRERCIRINIELPAAWDEHWTPLPTPIRYARRNSIGNLVSCGIYHAIVLSRKLHSKLFRVNHESREAATAFFRIRLPCHVAPDPPTWAFHRARWNDITPITLYLNPEYDILWLNPHTPIIESLVDFLYDVKAYDPRGVGLLNMALDHDILRPKFHNLHPSDMEAPAHVAFRDTLAHMRSIYLTFTLPAEARANWGGKGCDADVDHVQRLHRSVPLCSYTPVFDRVGPDPRSVADTLRVLPISCTRNNWHMLDPAITAPYWRFLLRLWGVERSFPLEECFLATNCTWKNRIQISSHESAQRHLQEEEQLWYRKKPPNGCEFPRVETAEELEREPETVIGFWLFPVKAMGEAPEEIGVEDCIIRPNAVMDLSGYCSELAVSYLS